MEHDLNQPYPLRCPVCGTAMVGEKAKSGSRDVMVHRCLNCDTTVEISDGADADEE